MGPTPGAETRDQPDEPGVLDAGGALQDLGVDALATGSSSVSGWLVLSGRRAG